MSGPAAERLKDKYASKLSQAEGEAKSLKDKQKELRDTHTTGLSQIDMMGDLVRLLQLKVWMGGRRGLTGGGLLCLIVQVDAFGWIPFSVAPVSIAPCSTMVQVDLQKREMGIAVSPPAPPRREVPPFPLPSFNPPPVSSDGAGGPSEARDGHCS